MAEQGRDVILQSMSFTTPQRCAACGMPPATSRTAKAQKVVGRTRYTRSFSIPYCSPCASRASATQMKGYLFTGIAFVDAMFFSSLGFLVPGLPAVVLIALPIIATLAFAIVAMTVLKPKEPALPAMGIGDAVKLVSFNGNQSTLHCVNPHFGEEFAKMNGVQALPKSRGHGFALGALLCAIVVAPIAAGVLWFMGHPQVHIDNTGTDAMQIWLDGKPLTVVQANASGASPPSVFVAHGKHTYGYSKVGASAPDGTVDGDTTVNDAHLYNPQSTGCYWLTADAYGAASVMGVQKGPQPVKEFYTFDQVDTWFGQNPDEIEVSNGETGGKRVAINRWTACMDLAKQGCDANARNQYVTCAGNAHDKASFDKCRAATGCAHGNMAASATHGGGSGGATPHGGAPPGQAAPPAGHASPPATPAKPAKK